MKLYRKVLSMLLILILLSMSMPTFSSAAGGNLALGKPATASLSLPNYTPDKAVNGTYVYEADKWCSGYTPEEKWIQVELGKGCLVNSWKVVHAGVIESKQYNTRDFRLQISNDGIWWGDVDAVRGNTFSITERMLPTFEAKYVRLYIDQATQNDNSCARIYEFQVHFDPDVMNHNAVLNNSDVLNLNHDLVGNFALNKTVNASASYGSQTPQKAVNGTWYNEDDKWCTYYTSEEKWLKIDLGKEYPINYYKIVHSGAVVTRHPEYNTRAFRVQSSTDGITWNDVDVVTNNTDPITVRKINKTNTRYMRLYIDQATQNDNSCARIHEFQVYFDYEGGNLALYKTATASASYGLQNAQKAVNGTWNNSDDKWCTYYTSAEKWLKIDLGRVYSFNFFRVVHSGAVVTNNPEYNTRAFRIQCSLDGITWGDAVVVTNNTDPISEGQVRGTARYVRLYIDQATQNDNSCARIHEFQIFNTAFTPKPDNLAYNKAATASHYISGEDPSKAVDGFYYYPNQWCACAGIDYGKKSWLRVDLGSTYTFNKWVMIFGEHYLGHYTNTFQLQASNDGISWITVHRMTGNQYGRCIIYTQSVTARYVRLYIERPESDNCARLHEFELYNTLNKY